MRTHLIQPVVIGHYDSCTLVGTNIRGKTVRMELPVTQYRVLNWILGNDTWRIQDAFPDLSDDQREFILTGLTSDDWDEIFGDDDYPSATTEDSK